MKGLGRMVLLVSSTVAMFACTGCVQTSRHAATPVVQQPRISAAGSVTSGSAGPSVAYSSSFEAVQKMPRLAFEEPEVYSAPLEISQDKPFSTSNLYSSAALTALAADRERMNLNAIPRDTRNLSAELTLSASAEQTGLGFDVGLAPRVSISRDGPYATRRVGGEVRIGQNFDKRGSGDPVSSWYLFAGADGEALVWEPNENGAVSITAMALRDKVTVGDIQAGISFQQGPGQLSFSYIRREVEYRERNLGASETEDFAGLSFTIRR